MPRPSLPQLLLAFIAGCALLWLSISVMGLLAAIPTPRLLQPLLQAQSWGGAILYSVLLLHIPMALLAGLFALAAFRLLRVGGPGAVLALSAPWLIYCFFAALSWYQGTQFSPLQILSLELAWHKWFGRLSVPLGVWIASIVSSGKARNAA